MNLENKDLGRQVQSLLNEMHQSDSQSLQPPSSFTLLGGIEDSMETASNFDDADTLISDHLVTFTSISVRNDWIYGCSHFSAFSTGAAISESETNTGPETIKLSNGAYGKSKG
jgi:hypothetical protein